MNERRMVQAALALAAALAAPVGAESVTFTDPVGDDNGPGGYVYPTDAVYTRGSFDLTELSIEAKGSRASVDVTLNTTLQDPWGMGGGFSVQMIFVFIDTDGKAGSGHTTAPAGLNVQFAPESAWEKCIVLSPQPAARVNQEIEAKGGALAKDLVVPTRTQAAGRTISGQVRLSEIGEGDPATWGYQVVVQSNEGFPADNDLLTRKVNEFEGQHRFGGGTDYDCDPHVIDVLGDHAQLAYECGADGSPKKMATLSVVRK